MNPREINKDAIIDWQLERLQTSDSTPMPQEMVDYVQQHPELAAELETLRQFWQPKQELPVPSANLKAGFYQALTQIQQNQIATETLSIKPSETVANDQYYRNGWFQAAAIALVFVLGLFTGRESSMGTSSQAIAALQEEVSSLSTVMAISMLQKESASERLAAISYTKQANMGDPTLLRSLLNSLAQEKSTAVKLAIIDAFKMSDIAKHNTGMRDVEGELLELALNESQPMVQMALIQLLLDTASSDTKHQLIAQLQALPLDRDVQEFLMLIDAQNRI